MICYKDRNYCSGGSDDPATRCASFSSCDRALTEDVKARAKAAGLWIAQSAQPEKLPCYVKPPKVLPT